MPCTRAHIWDSRVCQHCENQRLKQEVKDLQEEIEFSRLLRDSLESQLQHYRGYN